MIKKITAVILGVVLSLATLAGCAGGRAGESGGPYRKGYWVNNNFISSYTQTVFSVPKEWSKFSKSDIDELEAELSERGDSAVYDMAVSSAEGNSILMLGEDLTKIENGTELTNEKYTELLADNLQKNGGKYTYTLKEAKKMEFLEKECMSAEFEVQSESTTKTQLWLVRRIDDNMSVIIITAENIDAAKKLANSFHKYGDEVTQEGYGEEDEEGKPKKEIFLRGEWKELDGRNVFENATMNLRFNSENGWNVLSTKELNALSGNKGNDDLELTMIDGYDNISVFDFGVTTENNSTIVMLAEDLALDKLTENINERGYVEILEKLLKQTDLGYEFGDAEETEVAGRTFLKMPVTLASGEAQQWYLMERVGDHMVTIIVTASTQNADEMDAFMNAFEYFEPQPEEEAEEE